MKKASPFELLLMAALLITVIVYGGMKYLVTPLREEAADLSQQIGIRENEMRIRIGSFAGNEIRRQQLIRLNEATVPYAGTFFSDTTEDVYLEHIRKCIADCSLTFTSLDASTGSIGRSSSVKTSALAAVLQKDPLAPDIPLLQDSAGFNEWITSVRERGGRLETDVTATTIRIELSGKYNDVLKGIKGLMTASGRIMCSEMTLELVDNVSLKSGSNPDVRTVMTLVFVNVPPFITAEVPDAVPVFPMPVSLKY